MNDIDRACSEEVIRQLETDQDKYCKKSCTVKEFKASQVKTVGVNKETNQFTVEYGFELPESNSNLRSHKPFKTVKTEYLITTWISLIGTVGGTLGMFVGFSIIGTSQWFFTSVKKLLNK